MRIDTFDQDLFHLDEFADRLEKLIKRESKFVDDSLVISLNAAFGSGKSTFLKMWVNQLKQQSKQQIVVELNAWQDDYCGDPLISILSSMINSFNNKEFNTQELVDALKDIGWFITGISNQFVNKFTGINIVAASQLAEEKKNKRNNTSNIFELYNAKINALQSIKCILKKTILKNGECIIIVVDELDRCRPNYAISYLETIKHVFDIEGLVFILAVDRNQLETSAKAEFGNDLVFSEYYRKFVHREIDMPYPDEKYINDLVSEYKMLFKC